MCYVVKKQQGEAVVEAGQEQIVGALESMGLTDIATETITRNFKGEEHAGMKISGKVEDVLMYEQQVVVKLGNYLAVITAASYNEDTTDEVLDAFYAVQ